MTVDAQRREYADQITAVIEGFVKIWIKFEAMMHDDLAKTRHPLEEANSLSETHPDINYGLFYRVSSCIYGKSSLTMGELSSALSVPLSTATRLVDWLVINGYAQRLSDPEDRRVVRVALTDSGRELHRAISDYTTERVQQILSCLTDEEQRMLFTAIPKVVFALKDIAK